jgi:Tol biopolymer transport system component
VLDPGVERFDDVAYSPDGRTLVFWGADGADPTGGDGGSLYVMPDDGSGPAAKRTEETAGTDADPMFSADGQELVFRRRVSEGAVNTVQIFAMKSDGTGLRRLTNNPSNDLNPNFSPDGSQIVFKSDRTSGAAAGPMHLWIMNSDGSDQRQLTADDGSQDESGAAWGAR